MPEPTLAELLAQREALTAQIEQRTDNSVEALGVNVRALREARDWTQDDLGQRVGLSRASISNIEAGNQSPTWTTVCLFADLFGVSLDNLRVAASTHREPSA